MITIDNLINLPWRNPPRGLNFSYGSDGTLANTTPQAEIGHTLQNWVTCTRFDRNEFRVSIRREWHFILSNGDPVVNASHVLFDTKLDIRFGAHLFIPNNRLKLLHTIYGANKHSSIIWGKVVVKIIQSI